MVSTVPSAKLAIATFAGGCFWTMEHAFDDVPGVTVAISGYTGGHVANPSYEQVSTGTTGHVETVEVHYDPAKVSYAKLLDIYWHRIDPTQVGGQACDTGDEYRSMIFTHDAVQQRQAQAYKDALRASGTFHAADRGADRQGRPVLRGRGLPPVLHQEESRVLRALPRRLRPRPAPAGRVGFAVRAILMQSAGVHRFSAGCRRIFSRSANRRRP